MNSSLILSRHFDKQEKDQKYIHFIKEDDYENLEYIDDQFSAKTLKNLSNQIEYFYFFFLKKLTSDLNDIHNLKKTEKEWELVIGNWLRFFIEIVISRWVRLEKLNDLNFKKIYVRKSYKHELSYLTPKNRFHFSQLLENSKDWNENLLSIMSKYIFEKNKIEFIDSAFSDLNRYSYKYKKNSIKKSIIENSTKFISKLFNINKRMLVSTSYLGLYNIIYLSYKLRLFPFIYFTKIPPNYNEYSGLRNRNDLFSNTIISDNNLLNCLNHLIRNQIPKCYIEDWKFLKDDLQKSYFPKVKKILAGNGFDNDEVIRCYISDNIKNVDYTIFQHGGVYGLSFFPNKGEFYEKRVADKWISWGWNEQESPNIFPGINLRNIHQKLKMTKKGKNILIPLPYFSEHFTRITRPNKGQIKKDLNYLIHNISPKYKEKIKVRPFPNNISKKISLDIVDNKFIDTEADFYSSIKNSKIHISIVNATTFLQTIGHNFPTILFFRSPELVFREKVINDIISLKKVGILYDNIDEMIRFINLNYSNIDVWWNNKDVQDCIQLFRKKYSNNQNNWKSNLIRILK